jgi:hypothetical protein
MYFPVFAQFFIVYERDYKCPDNTYDTGAQLYNNRTGSLHKAHMLENSIHGKN